MHGNGDPSMSSLYRCWLYRCTVVLTRCALVVLVGSVSLSPHALAQTTGPVLDAQTIGRLVADQDASTRALQPSADALAWQWFVWLNSPLADPGPKVWESWRPTSTVYLPTGDRPPPWGTAPAVPQQVQALASQAGLDT